MDPERWRRLKEIFAEASEMTPAGRPGFLDHACAGDAQLRADVERLLRQDHETETLLPGPVKPHALSNGDLVADRFRIVRFVGKGGMGEVYQAEDLVLGGTVALKTMRQDLLADPTFLSRFRREVQLARQVTHRNICRMFDVGQHDPRGGGVVFLTMEFLEGETLQKVLAQRGAIPPGEALEIVRQIAAGLEALHAQNIIHRDLKPGNVMLTTSETGNPRAVITDFGLARVETQADASMSTALSQSGQLLGTPDYMAPEQLLGQTLTPAADVYSLGLIAYEMVTGARPFGGQGQGNALRRLTEAPPPPRTHAPGLSQNWENAILSCLARDPANRTPDAMGLIAAIDGSRPAVSATPPRSGRRTAIFAAAIFGILALSVGGWRLGKRSGEDARRGEARHVAVMPFTLLEEDPSVRVFADGLMEAITGRLSQYEGVNAPIQVVPASEVRLQKARTASDAAKLLGVNTAVEGRVQSQDGRVRLMLTVIDTRERRQLDTIVTEGQRQNSMGLQDDAITKLANALDLRVQTKYARDLQRLTPAAPGAHEYYLQARGYLQRNDKIESVDTSITLLDRALQIDKGYAPAVAALGEAYWYKYDLTKEKSWADRAIETCRRAVTMNSSLPEAHVTMGLVLNGTGRYGDALKEFEQAIAIDPRDNSAYQGMANSYTNLKEFDKAEATYLKAISLRPGDWSGYKALGLFHYRRAEYAKAIEQWERGASLTPDNAQVFVNLGAAYYFNGDLAGARKNLERALDLDPGRVSTLQNLGNLHYEVGEVDKAIEVWSRALKQNTRSYRLWGALASAYRRKGDQPRMREAVARAASLVESEMAVNPNRADLYTFLAHFRAMQGSTGARQLVDRAIGMSPDDPDILVRAAETFQLLGDDAAAVSAMRRAVEKGYSEKILRRSPTLGPLTAQLKPNQK